MPEETKEHYRIFASQAEQANLPQEIKNSIVEEYPAFVIATASADAIAAARQLFPVEQVTDHAPPPTPPRTANVDTAVTVNRRRGPYTLVVQFAFPLKEEWRTAMEATGSTILAALGSRTLVVLCPNLPTRAALATIEHVKAVGEYQPDVYLNDAFMELLEDAGEEGDTPPPAGEQINGMEDSTLLLGVLVATFFRTDEQQVSRRSLRRQGIGRISALAETKLLIDLAESNDPVQDIHTILARPGLQSLQERQLKRTFNDRARTVLARQVVPGTVDSLDLTGQGEIVAVADSGLDTGDPETVHADFRGRIKHIESFPIAPSYQSVVWNAGADDGAADLYSGHGTHVCGSVLGNGAMAVELGIKPIQGIAPEAKLVFQAIEQAAQWKPKYRKKYQAQYHEAPKPYGLLGIPDDLRQLFEAAYGHGARIHTNSWGGGQSAEYDDLCAALDEFVWDHKDFLVIFAAGNDAVDTADPDYLPADGLLDMECVTPPGTAKNCLTVGACEHDRAGEFPHTYGKWQQARWPKEPFYSDSLVDSVDDLAAFSSRGPCKTGRRKPDVVAPGTFILSTKSTQTKKTGSAKYKPASQHYMFNTGTSMATPLVAGCAALARQYLRTHRAHDNPSAALLKASLIHSCHYITYRFAHPASARWADNEQGWGRVDLRQVLQPAPPTQVIFLDEREGLPANEMREFVVEIGDATVPLRITLVYTDRPGRDLINNLNLFAYAPDNGGFYIGNDFANRGEIDANNNVEGIIVENPTPGAWRLRIVAVLPQGGVQDFALVISGGNAALVDG